MQVKVESLLSVKGICYVIVRQIESGEFSVSVTTRLNGVPLLPICTQPRKLRANGSLDLEVYVLALESSSDSILFTEGQIVELQH